MVNIDDFMSVSWLRSQATSQAFNLIFSCWRKEIFNHIFRV